MALPKWVTFGRIFHKTRQHSGPMCGAFKIEDRFTGQWSKTSCSKCLEWREKHKYDRQKKWRQRKLDDGISD